MTQHNRTSSRTFSSGFTLIEILVVIAIIAVLAGILLAALSGVQKAAMKTQSSSLMQSFARACDAFALDHGRYPGLLPDSAVNGIEITSTQNAMLELMGGARVLNTQSPSSVVDEYNSFATNATIEYPDTFEDPISGLTWSLVFDESRFGEGPWIAGRVYEPYFSPKSRDLQYTPFDINNLDDFVLPSLIDAWDTPIMYFRAGRKHGPIIDNPANSSDPTFNLPQYDLPGIDQFFEDALNTNGSIVGPVFATDNPTKIAWLTLLLAHPTFWEDDGSGNVFTNGVVWGTSRGRYLLISAGPDKIYLEIANKQMHQDQTIDPASPASSLLDPQSGSITPSMMETFDDVIVHGGA